MSRSGCGDDTQEKGFSHAKLGLHGQHKNCQSIGFFSSKEKKKTRSDQQEKGFVGQRGLHPAVTSTNVVQQVLEATGVVMTIIIKSQQNLRRGLPSCNEQVSRVWTAVHCCLVNSDVKHVQKYDFTLKKTPH